MSIFLYEVAAKNIRAKIQSDFQAALDLEATAQTDGKVPLRAPSGSVYYLYEELSPAQLPAVYILVDSFDYRLAEKGGNFINALGRIRCGMMLESFRLEDCQLMAYRYASALYRVLNEAQIEYTFGVSGVVVKNVVKVVNTSFSEAFQPDDPQKNTKIYRKEFVHDLEVEHYEKTSSIL